MYPLSFQQQLLDQLSTGRSACADPAGRIYHPVPRDCAPVIERMECIPYLAGVSPKTRKDGDLTVGGHASPGDPTNHMIDLLVAHEIREIKPAASSLRPGERCRQRWPRPRPRSG